MVKMITSFVLQWWKWLQALSHNGENDYKLCLTMVKMITSFVLQWWKWLQALSHNGENDYKLCLTMVKIQEDKWRNTNFYKSI
jgi:thiamine monophosphate kinase